jgi:hydroxymethylglutaryl-CoA lyase
MKSRQVFITEVGPRDGLQNISQFIKTETKVRFINALMESGLEDIEVSSFVSNSKVPQLADADVVFNKIQKSTGPNYFFLVPNLQGAESALNIGANGLALFTATSETFNQKNINASIDESLSHIKSLVEGVKTQENYEKLKFRAHISTVFGCPYEGKSSPKSLDNLKKVSEFLFENGVHEVVLADTVGMAGPTLVKNVIKEMRRNFDLEKVGLHFHDTLGMGITNIMTGFQEGIKHFDSSAGGLGGCPFAGSATGNVATEEVLHLFEMMNIKTGIKTSKILEAAKIIFDEVKGLAPSRYYTAKNKECSP